MSIETDVVIIGAGPAGLFQVFELGLLDLRAHVVEALDKPGGQCAELYPGKPIYDIPAFPSIDAGELVARLLEQIRPFEPAFHLGQRVETLRRLPDDRLLLRTHTGTELLARAVVIAGGVGAFEPVRLKVDGAARHAGRQLHYAVADPERFAGREIVVLGGGDSALDWALELRKTAASVVLVHRSERFRAAPASVARMRALCEALEMQSLVGNVTGLIESEGATATNARAAGAGAGSAASAANDAIGGDARPRLAGVEVTGADGVARRVDCDELLVFFGLSPKLGPIADWGLERRGSQIRVDTAGFETSEPGVFAVGDINCYPGKKKLILSGFHEAALAAFAIKERLSPGQKVHLQYTTTSPVMHRRLGVDDPYAEDEAAAA